MIRFDSSLPSRLTQPNRVSSATRPTAANAKTHKKTIKCNFPLSDLSAWAIYIAYIPVPICRVHPKNCQAIHCSRRASRALCPKNAKTTNGNSVRVLYLAIVHIVCECDIAVNYLSIKSLAISLSGTMYLRAVDGCSITCWTCARKLSHFSPWLRSLWMNDSELQWFVWCECGRGDARPEQNTKWNEFKLENEFCVWERMCGLRDCLLRLRKCQSIKSSHSSVALISTALHQSTYSTVCTRSLHAVNHGKFECSINNRIKWLNYRGKFNFRAVERMQMTERMDNFQTENLSISLIDVFCFLVLVDLTQAERKLIFMKLARKRQFHKNFNWFIGVQAT